MMPLVVILGWFFFGCAPVLLAQDTRGIERQRANDHLALIEQAYAGRVGPQGGEWRERVRTEEPALVASLEWLIRNGEGEQALRVAAPMAYFWNLQGRAQESRDLLTRVLATPSALKPTAIRARALYDAGLLAFRQRDQAASRRLNEESLEISRQLRDKNAMATALVGLSRVALRNLDYPGVRAFAEESATIRRELGDKRGEAQAQHMVAAASRMQGKYERAAELYEFSLAVNREVGNEVGIAVELFNLGYVRLRQRDIPWARRLFGESLGRFRALNNEAGFAYNFTGFAAIAVEEKKPERAARLYGAADALLEKLKITLDPDDQLEVDHYSAKARTHLSPAAFEAASAEGRAMPLERALTLALAGP